MKKIIFNVLFTLTLIFGLTSCVSIKPGEGSGSGDGTEQPKVEVNFSTYRTEMMVGEKLQFVPAVENSDSVENFALTYTVSNDAATVDANGWVTAQHEGTVVLVARANDEKRTYDTLVIDIKPFEEGTEITYVVTYDANGGHVEKLNEEFTDYTTVVLPVPTKEGCRFGGWYEGETKVNALSENRHYSLVAHWLSTYAVTYDENGGSEVADDAFYAGEADTIELPVPTREHYEFAGWYDGETKVTTLTEDRDYTLVAKWNAVEYTVTFKAEGNLVAVAKYTVENTTVTEPQIPAKEHYTAKWEEYTLTNGNVEVNAEYVPVEYKVTFKADGQEVAVKSYTVENIAIEEPQVPAKVGYTAKWESYELTLSDAVVNAEYTVIEYKVTFNADGQEVAVKSYTVENKAIEEPQVPAKEHYTAKWEEYTLTTGDVEVNAIYTAVTYTVTFKAEGQEVAVKSYTVENKAIEEPQVPAKVGYTAKWAEYVLDFTNATVEAEYTIINYTVTFDAGEGVENPASLTINVENYQEAVLPTVSKEGYNFLGWYEGENKVEALENRAYELVAEWQEIPATKVTYDLNGGVFAPYKSFTLGGWNAYGSSADKPYYMMSITTPTSTVTNKWWARMLIKEVSTGVYEAVHAQLSGNITYEGEYDYIIGISTSTGYDKTTYAIIDAIMDEVIAGEKRYLALDISEYVELASKVVNIPVNVYKELPATVVEYKEDATSLPAAQKEGYTFDGWYNGETKVESITVGSDDVTLKAQYTAIEYTIEYVLGEGTTTATLVGKYTIETETFALPTVADMAIEGGTFKEWQDADGNVVTEIEQGSMGNITLTAIWEMAHVPTTTVTYNLNNGAFVVDYEFEIQNFNDYANGLNTGATIGIVPIDKAASRMNYTWKRIVIEYDAELGLWYSAGVGSTSKSADISGSANAYVIGSNNGATDKASKAVVEAIFTAVSEGTVYYFNLGTFTLDNIPSASGSWNQLVKADTDPELVSDNTISYKEDVAELPQAQKAGYTFNGWYANAELTGEAVTAISIGEEDATVALYAKFTPITYTITWNLDGGTTTATLVESYTVESDTIVLPTSEVMSMEGAQFAGWLDADGNEVTEIATGSIGNVQLTAQWVLDQASELAISDEHASALNAIHTNKSAVATILVNPEITSAAKYVLANSNLVEDYTGVEYIYGENLFSSVADALAKAEANSIIYVFGGTHTGDLTISVANITLAGPNYGISYKETRNTEATVSGMINIGANGFTMDGFTYTGSAKAYKVTAATADLVIKNNIITATGTSTSGGRTGIVASDPAINGFTFVGNSLVCTGTAGKNAFAVYGTLTNANISNNKISNGAGSGAASNSELIRAAYIAGTFTFDNNDCLWGTKNYSIYAGWTSNSCTTVSISNNTLLGSSAATTTTIGLRRMPANSTFNFVGNTFDYFDTGSTIDFRYANATSTINIKDNVFGTSVLFKAVYVGDGTVNWSGNEYNGGLSSDSTVTPGDYTA